MLTKGEALPTGKVTLLFTDIEGSTRLLQDLGEGFGEVLAAHNALLREVWSAHGGVEVSMDGDAFFVAFAEAQGAVDAALAAQQTLGSYAWPAGGRVRVRMGLHTGRPRVHERERDYWGVDVHFAARVAAAAHGGQVLLSRQTADLVSAPFEDLGDWRLKDFDGPCRLFQLVVDGEDADCFPPPRALDVLRTNVPVPPTQIIGREMELAELLRLLVGSSARLVTIVGLGGAGKTRLALEAGHALLEHFTDGVFFADLSGVAEPAAIPRAVANAIGVSDRPDVPIEVAVGEHLQARRVLLIMDNCEHLVGGVAVIAGWLQSAAELRVLATSQVSLRLRAEHCVPLDSLELAGAGANNLGALAEVPSVRLFVERASAANPQFELDAQNCQAVAEVCRRLDGMPMAIELAAARVKLLSPDQLYRRLRDDFSILAAPARDAPARQTSLQAALDWTLGLLEPEQRTVFARWGVFAGRPTLQRAEAIFEPDLDVLGAIDALLDFSLLRGDPDGRLRMPQSVHAHARKMLEASGELEQVRSRHAAVMADVAEALYVGFWMDTEATLADVAVDRDDLYTALSWAGTNRADLHARLAGSMVVPLLLVGNPISLESDVERALVAESEPTRARLRLLVARATIAYARGDRDRERDSFEHAVGVSERLGDEREHALTLATFAKAVTSGDQPAVNAQELLNVASASAARVGDAELEQLAEGLRADAYVKEGRFEEAERLYTAITSDTQARHFAAYQAPMSIPEVAFIQGDHGAALDGLVSSVRDHPDVTFDMGWTLEQIGCCLIALGHPARGLALIAASEQHSTTLGMEGRPRELSEAVSEHLLLANRVLGEAAAQHALEHGRQMRWDAAVGLALRAPTIVRNARPRAVA